MWKKALIYLHEIDTDNKETILCLEWGTLGQLREGEKKNCFHDIEIFVFLMYVTHINIIFV